MDILSEMDRNIAELRKQLEAISARLNEQCELREKAANNIAAQQKRERKQLTRPEREVSELPDNDMLQDNAEGFVHPKKSKRVRQEEEEETYATYNRFQHLQEDDDNHQDSQPDMDTQPPAQPKREHVPPIILRNKEKWMEVSAAFTKKSLNFNSARMTHEGVKIMPQTPDDYRGITKLLEKRKLEFHTFQLRSEKYLKVVLKGIMQNISDDDIKADLEKQGFPAAKVQRMMTTTTHNEERIKTPLPMVLVEIDKRYKSIYDYLTFVCGLRVRIESLRRKIGESQCYRCQRYGHVQHNCRAQVWCVKCAGNHHTQTCEKPRTAAATCVNCGGNHPANFRGCPSYTARTQTREPRARANPWTPERRQREERTEVAEEQQPAATPAKKDDITAILKKIMEQQTTFMQQISTVLTRL